MSLLRCRALESVFYYPSIDEDNNSQAFEPELSESKGTCINWIIISAKKTMSYYVKDKFWLLCQPDESVNNTFKKILQSWFIDPVT